MHELGYLASTKDDAHFTFRESASKMSCTSTTIPRCVLWLGRGLRLVVTDTPGLSDTGGDKHDQTQLAGMVTKVRRLPGVSVFLIVLDSQKTRWTKVRCTAVYISSSSCS